MSRILEDYLPEDEHGPDEFTDAADGIAPAAAVLH